MRCPDCNKFVGLDFADPEVEADPEIDDDGAVSARVRIIRTCADCGTELKEASLDLETEVDVTDHVNEAESDKHELSVESDSVDQIEEGGGRYQKSFFGAEVSFTVTCKCDPAWKIEGKLSDKVAASAMEELT